MDVESMDTEMPLATMPLHMKDLIIHTDDFGVCGESWNQFTPLPKTEGPHVLFIPGNRYFFSLNLL